MIRRSQYLLPALCLLMLGAFAAPTMAKGVYLRVTVQSVKPSAQKVYVRLSGYQKVWQRLFALGLSPQGQLMPVNMRRPWADFDASKTFTPGQPGAWTDVTALFSDFRGPKPAKSGLLDSFYGKFAKPDHSKLLTLRCHIPAAGRGPGQIADQATYRLDFATAPNNERIVASFHGTAYQGPWTLVIPKLTGNIQADASHITTLENAATQRLKDFQGLDIKQAPLAKRMLLSSWVKTWPDIYDRRTALTEARVLRLLGVNVLKGLADAPGVKPQDAQRLGVSMRFYELGGPPKKIRNPFLPDRRQAIAKWLGDRHVVNVGAPNGPVVDRLYVKIEDEPHLFGVNFNGNAIDELESPEALTSFRRWLAQRGVDPASIGVTSLDQAKPYPLHRELYRSEIKDDSQARLAYLTVWFLQDATADFFKHYSQAVHDAYNANALTCTCIPFLTWRAPWLTFNYRPDPFIWSRRKVMDVQMHHYSRNAWQTAEEPLFTADLLRSASKFGETDTGVLWALPTGKPTANTLDGMSALIHGIHNFYQYYYEPTSNPWTSEEVKTYAAMSKIYHLAARCEDLLLDGDSPMWHAQVAMLFSRGSEVWQQVGVYVEERALIGAMAYNQVPIDILPEEEVAKRMDDYKVIYLPAPNLKPTTQTALKQWVRAGGVLFTVGDSGTRDELDRPSDFLRDLFGADSRFKVTAAATTPFNGITPKLAPKTLGHAVWQGPGKPFTFEVVGKRESMSVPGSTTLAHYPDGGAAALQAKVGRGCVIRVGTLPAVALERTAKPAFTDPVVNSQRDYDPNLYRLLLYPLKLAKVQPKLTISAHGVDATWYEHGGKALILMANYRATRLGTVDVRARLAGHYKRCKTMDGRSLPVTRDGAWTVIRNVPIDIIQALFLN